MNILLEKGVCIGKRWPGCQNQSHGKGNFKMTKFDKELGIADFILFGDEEYKVVFHFFTRDSRCHSFNDDPPKNWNEVYKVYYSWSITQNMLGMDDEVVESEVLIDVVWDECSRLTELSFHIKDVIQNEAVKVHLVPLGQPASEWYICRVDEDSIKFTVWNDPLNVGYRFKLSNEKAEEFAWFLDDVNQYMLEHGEGI